MRNKKPPLTGTRKFLKIKKLVGKIDIIKIKTILDVGGIFYTYSSLKKLFPNSKIISLNTSKNAMLRVENPVVGDAEELEKYFDKDSIDLIFAGDVLEHLLFPHKFIEGAKRILKKDGYLIITTPNLACIFNRIFLLFGYSPSNYDPVSGKKTGNPFMKGRYAGEHKSVFTFKGLKEWIISNGFKIVKCEGFDYGNENLQEREKIGGKFFRLRKVLDEIVPLGWKEGIIILCKKTV